jgi:hypothetical protein
MSLDTAPRIGKIATAVTDHAYPIGIAVVHDMAYVGEYFGQRLTTVDVSNPTAPVPRSQLVLNNRITGVAAFGNRVYLTGADAHLQIVDTTNPTAPVLTANVAGSGWAIAADANYVYIANYGGAVAGNKLRIYDVTAPASPALKSEIAIGTGFSDIVVIGTVAYLCTDGLNGGGNWLRLYDVSDPASPALGGSVSLGSATFRCMATDGRYAYVGVGDGSTTSKLVIYDVANPTAAPVVKGSLAINGIPGRVTLVGNVVHLSLYISEAGAMILDTIDVSDVAAPVLRDYTSVGSGDGGLFASIGEYLLVPGAQFDVYATEADLTTGSLRVSAGITVDSAGRSNGGLINGITFGNVSGEGISSRRALGGNLFGIDFYTAFANRMAITNGGRVGIGRPDPQYTLEVNGSVAGVGAYSNVSDGRYKQRVEPIQNAVERLEQLAGVTFDWKPDERPDFTFPQGRQLGLVAQEVEAVFPEAVTTAEDGTKSVAYSTLVPVLIQAIKEQQRKIDAITSATADLARGLSFPRSRRRMSRVARRPQDPPE